MKVPLLDLAAQHRALRDDLLAAMERVLDSQKFIMGPDVAALEADVAAYTGAAHGVGVASGTDAILLALRGLGVGPGQQVVVPAFTFFASAGPVHHLGATPLFCDIDPGTFNLTPETVSTAMEKAAPGRISGVVPVHLFGLCADMDGLGELARERGLFLLEDMAQALGAALPGEGPRKAGTLGAAACISFFPSKVLGGAGDGGMVLTGDDELADRLRMLRVHGSRPKYHNRIVGYNSRLDTLQAALLRVKLKHLDRWIEARSLRAANYDRLLREAGIVQEHPGRAVEPGRLVPPVRPEGYRHVMHQYVVRVRQRDSVAAALKDAGIGTAVYYPVPLHLQDCFADRGYQRGDLPEAERACEEVLALPIYPELTNEQQQYVVEHLAQAVAA